MASRFDSGSNIQVQVLNFIFVALFGICSLLSDVPDIRYSVFINV